MNPLFDYYVSLMEEKCQLRDLNVLYIGGIIMLTKVVLNKSTLSTGLL